jgi:alpha-glucosidase
MAIEDYSFMSSVEQNSQYIYGMRPVLNRAALFSDTSSQFVIPMETDPYTTVRVRFRTARNNVDAVKLVQGRAKDYMTRETASDDDGIFDYYYYDLQVENEVAEYYFEVTTGHLVCCYDKRGAVRTPDAHYRFRIIPGFRTPEWAKGAVMYQIYVDRFCNGDPSNDVLDNEYCYLGHNTVHMADWNTYPSAFDVHEFYGGDLQGVISKLDYLQELGIDAIYFNPLFLSPSNHKYDIQDYDYIDPHFGKIENDVGELLQPGRSENRYATRYITRVTDPVNLEAGNRMFAGLVQEAHRRGIRVILDGVFNHCGSFNKWMDRERIYEGQPGYEKGAYISADSPYRNFFAFSDQNRWPYNPTYEGWWGHDTLPKLNYEASDELFDYVMRIARKWVSPPYNADGWRMDVAADLGHSPEFNHHFWKEFRRNVKEANPDAIILAEHYGSPLEWLQGDEWDAVMNYDAFMEPVTWFLTGMEKHSDDSRQDKLGNTADFWNAMGYSSAELTEPSLLVTMNELSNHDHSRFLTRTNRRIGRTNTLGPEAANEGVSKAVMREAVVMQMTWPGMPTVYYGDEAGMCGFTDPDNRRTYPWGREDQEMISFHRDMIRLHKGCSEMRDGSVKKMDSEYGMLAYGRFDRHGHSLIIVNNNGNEMKCEFTVKYLGIPQECVMKRMIITDKSGYSLWQQEYAVVMGNIKVTMPPTSAMILRYQSG